jgi:small subunit ribosomal protein S16
VVIDSRAPRDGRPIEEVGFYHPIEIEERQVKLKEDRIKDWLAKGAQPSNTVRMLLKRKNIAAKENKS